MIVVEATDLRIGCLVYAKSPEKKEWIKNHPINISDLGYLYNKNFGVPVDIRPQILDDDTMVCLGFKQHIGGNSIVYTKELGYYYLANGEQKRTKLKVKHINTGSWRVENFGNKSIYLMFVHELQNLFHAMNKENLIYTRP